MSYTFEVIEGGDAFAATEDAWAAIIRRDPSATAFLSWPVLSRAWVMVQDLITPRIYLFRSADGVPVGLLPLGCQSIGHRPFRTQQITSLAPGLVDDSGLIADPNHLDGLRPQVDRILSGFVRGVTSVDIRPVPRSNPLAQATSNQPTQYRLEPIGPSRIIPLTGLQSWTDVVRLRNLRHGIQRSERRLHQAGGAITVARNTVEIGRAAAAFLRIHDEGQRRKGRRSKFTSGSAAAAFPTFLAELVECGMLEVTTAAIGDTIIAVFLMLRFRQRATGYRTTFDATYGQYSAGTLLLAHAIGRAITLGETEFSLGCGGDAYKERWAAPAEEYCRVLGHPRTPRYRLGRLLDRLWS